MKIKHVLFFTIYVLIQNGVSISKAQYSGMTQTTIDGLLKEQKALTPGMTYQFVDKATFDGTVIPIVIAPVDTVRTQAVADAKDKTKSPQARLDALIRAIDLK